MGEWFIVTERCATMRMLARESLEGKWKLGFFGVFIYNMILGIPFLTLFWLFDEVGAFLGIAYVFVVAGPAQLGLSVFALAVLRNKEPQLAQVFYGFENFGRAFGLFVVVSLIIAAWSLIFFAFLFAFAFLFVLPGMWFAAFAILPLMFASTVPVIIALLRYSQSFFILADNPDAGIIECAGGSKRIMGGNKAKLFLLYLSFLGWSALANIPVFAAEVLFPFEGIASLPGFLAVSIIPSIGVCFVQIYLYVGVAVFYDMVSGNLRPGYVQATAEIVSENRIYPQAEEKTEESKVSLHKEETSDRRDY